jgi:hypothetical protein
MRRMQWYEKTVLNFYFLQNQSLNEVGDALEAFCSALRSVRLWLNYDRMER